MFKQFKFITGHMRCSFSLIFLSLPSLVADNDFPAMARVMLWSVSVFHLCHAYIHVMLSPVSCFHLYQVPTCIKSQTVSNPVLCQAMNCIML